MSTDREAASAPSATGPSSEPDAGYERVRLEPAANPLTGRPLDLSGAMLRSVSPVHLEYLANMGVVSSMSVSLIDRGQLWGLISCHHYAGPHRPSVADRIAAEFLGRTASLLLHTVVAEDEQEGVVDVAEHAPRHERDEPGPGGHVEQQRGEAVGQCLRPAPARLGVGHEPLDAGQGGVVTDGQHPHSDRRVRRHRRPTRGPSSS